jgi:hypothetical protein
VQELTTIRSNLLRVCYAALAIGLGLQVYPRLFGATMQASFDTGVVDAMLSALALLSLLGIVAPWRMVPLLVFEVVWKVTWFVAVALPKWATGTMDETTFDNLVPIGLVLPFILVLPWKRLANEVLGAREGWR